MNPYQKDSKNKSKQNRRYISFYSEKNKSNLS